MTTTIEYRNHGFKHAVTSAIFDQNAEKVEGKRYVIAVFENVTDAYRFLDGYEDAAYRTRFEVRYECLNGIEIRSN